MEGNLLVTEHNGSVPEDASNVAPSNKFALFVVLINVYHDPLGLIAKAALNCLVFFNSVVCEILAPFTQELVDLNVTLALVDKHQLPTVTPNVDRC